MGGSMKVLLAQAILQHRSRRMLILYVFLGYMIGAGIIVGWNLIAMLWFTLLFVILVPVLLLFAVVLLSLIIGGMMLSATWWQVALEWAQRNSK